MTKVNVFRHVGQRLLSSTEGQKFWHGRTGLIIRNVHVKYESSTRNNSKVMVRVEIFRYVGQRSR